MGFRCGIVGLPNAGKSTIFNALTAAAAEVASYPFCTIEPNMGIVPVPDERLPSIAQLIKPKRVTPTTLEFVDIAGLVKGASKGEGLGNQFLGYIRDVDAIAHVVRCFAEASIAHIYNTIDPRRDVEIVNSELIIADLDAVDRRLEKQGRLLRLGEREAEQEFTLLKDLKSRLERGLRASTYLTTVDTSLSSDLHLLTAKPTFYVANVGEGGNGAHTSYLSDLMELAETEGIKVVTIAGKLEAEIAQLPQEERKEFRRALGLKDSSLERLINVGHRILNLITFFTTVNQDLKAWTVPQGTLAPQAAGKIHSDMERGFIRTEVISFEEFIACGSEHSAREKGLMRSEGKEYMMRDGDIAHFRFHV